MRSVCQLAQSSLRKDGLQIELINWPEGDVVTQVAAVIEGRKTASGSLASMMFQSTLATGTVPGTYP